jgi:RNA-directed DNA polymerase
VGAVTKAYGMVNYHVTNRLRRWLCAKHRVRGPGYSRYPDAFLYQKLGLYQLRSKRPSLRTPDLRDFDLVPKSMFL